MVVYSISSYQMLKILNRAISLLRFVIDDVDDVDEDSYQECLASLKQVAEWLADRERLVAYLCKINIIIKALQRDRANKKRLIEIYLALRMFRVHLMRKLHNSTF